MPDFAAATIEWGTPPTAVTLLDLTNQFLGITDGSRDTDLSMFLQMAGEAAEAYIDNKLAQQDVTERFARSYQPVALRFFPVSTLISVFIDGEDVSSDWGLYFDPGVPWATAGSLTRAGDFEQMDLTYTAGFEPLPTDVGYAIVVTAIAYDRAGGNVTGTVRKESIVGVGSIEYVSSDDINGAVGMLSPSVLGTLERYRRMNA